MVESRADGTSPSRYDMLNIGSANVNGITGLT
jgi:hypothetical protein